jgi:hypothetical protein
VYIDLTRRTCRKGPKPLLPCGFVPDLSFPRSGPAEVLQNTCRSPTHRLSNSEQHVRPNLSMYTVRDARRVRNPTQTPPSPPGTGGVFPDTHARVRTHAHVPLPSGVWWSTIWLPSPFPVSIHGSPLIWSSQHVN